MAKQVGNADDQWSWVEPSVWTERMLAALVMGVKGGKWFSLMDKVYCQRNLQSAFTAVKRNKGAGGVDHQTIEMFENDLERNLQRLERQLKDGTYSPKAVRRVTIPKPGSKEGRPLGIPCVSERVVQGALRHVIEPIFELEFSTHSYGFRPGRSCKAALRRVDGLLKGGNTVVVDADLKSYFDTIPHDKLLAKVQEKVADGRVIELIEKFLKQEVMEGSRTWTPEEGSPQGAVLSPLLSNLYLNPLDHLMAASGFEMVRYADDFVILCRDRVEAERALSLVRMWTGEAGLTLHPEKTKIVDVTQREKFSFLGYEFGKRSRWPRKKSLTKLKDAIRAKTHRNNGKSLDETIQSVNVTLKGWFEYFKHSSKSTFPKVDGWVRMRLRSILRKRQGRKGHGYGRDHQRWPDAFFVKHGLYSLTAARVKAVNPLKR